MIILKITQTKLIIYKLNYYWFIFDIEPKFY